MTSKKIPLRFMLDASAPESVALAIEADGHVAIRHNDVLAEAATDVVVCRTAIANAAILVAVDGDMKQLTKRFNNSNPRFARLDVVMIGCNAAMSSKRLAQGMSIIEHEWATSQKKAASRLWFEITNHRMTTYR